MIVIEGFPIPIDVLIGWVCVLIFGMILGAVIYLPYAQKDSELPLERLTGDWVWNYAPEWILLLLSCIIFLLIGFMLISGLWRM
ncbi:MAG: hypothetical protein IJT73_03135 [Selenomonadaceae bacterium]|nr:hypothetical protein [Selenomonadaceae bacterium]